MRRWRTRGADLKVAALLALAAVACSAAAASRTPVAASAVVHAAPGVRGPRDASRRDVRILLAEGAADVRLTSAGGWRVLSEDGRTAIALPQPGERWRFTAGQGLVNSQREDSRAVTGRERVVLVVPDGDGVLEFNGRRWRGTLAIDATGAALRVVNRVAMDDYLQGVVPLEIGTSAAADAEAIAAQAVAARSYAVTHLGSTSRPWDMRATVLDQVYGGVNAETGAGNRAVRETSGLVLLYGGRAVNAPYHAACGGSTAEPQDVWNTGSEPWLQRVSDRIPGTDRDYCDQAPRYRWDRNFGEEELRSLIARYLQRGQPGGTAPSAIRGVSVSGVTPAGRVARLTVDTDRGPVVLRGDAIRGALRLPSGGLLYSTYFSVATTMDAGRVRELRLHGGGNGHGVGMCQSGAIGRARAGQDFRRILQTYYPGASIGYIE